MRIAMCAVLKMEEIYVRDWIDYYLKLGVGKFYLYDNNDLDYQFPLRPMIQDYIDNGTVELNEDYLGVTGDIQAKIYNQCLKQHRMEHDWMAFFDIDEYLFLHQHSDLREYLSQGIFSDAHACFPWTFYDSDSLDFSPIPIWERCNQVSRYNDQRWGVKTIVNCKFEVKKSVHSLHNKDDREHRLTRIVYADGSLEMAQEKHGSLSAQDLDRVRGIAELRHYYFKTPQEFLAYKQHRGRSCDPDCNYVYNIPKHAKYWNERYWWLVDNTNGDENALRESLFNAAGMNKYIDESGASRQTKNINQ